MLTNAEIVEDQYAAANERDWERALGHYAEGVVLVVTAGIRAGTFRGRDAVGEWFGDWFRTFDRGAYFDIEELAEFDDRVVVVAVHRAKGRGSGAAVEGAVNWAYQLREGKVVRQEAFNSREEALEAAGIPESLRGEDN